MKYITVISLMLAVIIMGSSGASFGTVETAGANSFLRIHIRANSNEVVDQTVKYQVKNKVVEALIPILAGCDDKQTALTTIKNNFGLIEEVVDEVLKGNGFNYTSKARVCEEYFPTRSYEQVVLGGGFYDALILDLGTGEGNNWWCVVYPPLCFVNSSGGATSNIKYKSKLLEIIESFFN
jgi:stage II sporulation protein R